MNVMQTVFLVSSRPPSIDIYIFSICFVLLTVFLIVIGFNRRFIAHNLTIVALLGVGLFVISSATIWTLWSMTNGQRQLYQAYEGGRDKVYDGCLEVFSPSKIAGHTPDTIRVAGHEFSYSDNNEDGGYHLTEISGGYIHADTLVKVYAVGDVIVRLDVREHGCPMAPAV